VVTWPYGQFVTVGAQLLIVYVLVVYTVDVVYGRLLELVVEGVTWLDELDVKVTTLDPLEVVATLDDVGTELVAAVNEYVMQEHAELRAEGEAQLLKSVGIAVTVGEGARYARQKVGASEAKRGSARFL
jgi:hypothetical protein